MKNRVWIRILCVLLICLTMIPVFVLGIEAAGATAQTSTTGKTLKITQQPKSMFLDAGSNAWFSVSAEGEGLRYNWQYSDDFGATWEKSGITTAAYSFVATSDHHERRVRCVVTDASGKSLTSKTATLFIEGLLKIVITEQPKNVIGAIGETVQFSVDAEGTALHFMWQYSTDGVNWSDLGITERAYSLEMTQTALDRVYRCKVWDDYGHSTTSDVVKLREESNLILVQPQDWVGCASGKAFFEVAASESVVSYQWQISTDNGSTWKNSSVKGAYYSTTATSESSKWLYRCIVQDGEGREQISDAVSLSVTDRFYIAKQPTDLCGNFGQSVVFAIQAGGTDLQFEWQRSDDGTTWSTVVKNAARLPQTVQMYNVGRYYRCVVTNGDGATLTSEVVQLNRASKGFFAHEGMQYYLKENGRIATGLVTIGDQLYYFSQKGVVLTGFRKLNNKYYYFLRGGAAAKGFTYVHDVCGTLYFGEDGAAVTGWKTIDGKTYYFYSETGARAWGITQIGDKEYYFDTETGVQKTGLVKVGLNDYMYFDQSKGTTYTGLKTINGKLYYFAASGALKGVAQSNLQTVGGKTYYFDSKTKQAVSGLITEDNNTYFMGSDYAMVKDSFVKVGTKTYLTGSNGVICHGLVTYKNKKYYFDSKTGAAVSGWVDVNGAKMYFDQSTYAAKTGLVTIDGVKYYFSSSGYLQTGIQNVSGVRYYCTEKGKLKTGFVEINKRVYYVYSTQKVATGLKTINKKLYYFGTDGVMAYGRKTISGKQYYFDPDTGAAKTGLIQLGNGYTYYFNGASGSGSGLTKISGNLYCLDSSGIVRYGRISINGKYYFFDPATGKALSGWQYIQGSNNTVRKAYFDPTTYCAVTGLKKIGGKLYYFDTSGWVMSGIRTIKGVTYYFSPNTYEAYTGWYKNSDGKYSYYNGEKGRLTGPAVHKINGAYYYIDAYARRRTGLRTVKGVRMYFDPVTAQVVSGFVYTNGKLYYFNGLKGPKPGLQTIGGNQYYFDKTGAAVTGMVTVGKVKCYFDETTGVRKYGLIYLKKTGRYYLFDKDSSTGVKTSKATLGGVLYVGNPSGVIRTGYCHKSLSKLGYDVYLDTKTGEQQLGLITFKNSSGKKVSYYFKKNGCLTNVTAVNKALKNALKKNGWHTIEGVKYYVKNGAFYKGKKKVGSNTYYFSSLTGAMLTGRRKIGNSYYYFDTKTGAMKTGFVSVDGKRCYFDPKSGAQAMGLKTVSGYTYYFVENGALTGTVQKGAAKYVFNKIGAGKKAAEVKKTAAPVQAKYAATWRTISGKKYYYNMNGKRVTGLQTIGGKLYYFDSSGAMKTGRIKVGSFYYYFGKTGAQSGKITISNKEYYFSPTNFVMLTGLRKIGTTLSYYNESGAKQTGWIKTKNGERLYINSSGVKKGLTKIGDKTYYFGDNGILRTGLRQVTASDGTKNTYLFDANGVMVTGLVKNSSGIFYYNPKTGARVTGFVKVDGKEYYFDPVTGAAKTGLYNVNGVTCYFDKTTGQRKYGLQKVNGQLRYFNQGTTAPGYATGLKTVDGKKYYFYASNGIALTGFQIKDGVKYYFDPTTCAAISGIRRVSGGHAYYFNASGGVKTGWVTVSGKSYFFYPATGMMAEGLSSVGDYLYYFDYSKGALRNTTVTVGGVSYQFDEDGHGKAMGDSLVAKLINTGIENFDKSYGGESDMENPKSFSCSQLVMYVYESIGVDLKRRPPRQYHMLANNVYESEIIDDISKAKAGDVIFFITTNCGITPCDFENEVHHVGVYLGDGKILESYGIEGDSINNGPMIRDVSDGLWSSFIYGLVRINGVE